MVPCKLSGCSNPSRNKAKPGFCKAHYERNRKTGHPGDPQILPRQPRRGLFAEIRRPEIDRISLSYWAGFFDGEGSVGIYARTNGFSFRCTISQKQKHDAVLRDISRVYGGSVIPNGDMSCLQLSSLRAYEFLRDIRPYTRVKTDQIELFISTVQGIRSGRYLNLHEISETIAELKR